ncbi:MAG TPA: hypothetical protein VF585_02285 [Chthoniobacterales bacterium]|jgi:hypothetical protein
MELLVATLCDTASENQGKLNVIGAFDAIIAQSFPAGFSFMLALRFSFTAEDHGSHPFSIRLVDDSGSPNNEAPNESKMDVNMPPGTAGFSTQNMIMPLQGTIAKAGNYHFDVHFDERILARIPLRVIAQSDLQAPAAPAAN